MRSLRFPVLCCCLVSLACQRSRSLDPAASVIDTLPSRTVRVRNLAPAEWKSGAGWTLTLVAAVHPPDGDPGELANPTMRDPYLTWSGDSEVLVADRTPAAIKRYDASGKFLGVLGREGDGPGEYQDPTITSLGPWVASLGVRNARVQLWRNGQPAATWIAESQFRGWTIHLDTLQHFYNYTSLPDPVTDVLSQTAWLRWGVSGSMASVSPPDTIRIPPLPASDFPFAWKLPTKGIVIKPMLPVLATVVDPGGRVLWGSTGAGRWFMTATGRDTIRTFEVSDSGPTFDPAARDSVVRAIIEHVPESIREELRQTARGSDLPARLPAWREILFDADGMLWVSRYGRDGNIARFSIFTPEGIWRGDVTAPPGLGRAVAVNGRYLADLREGDDGKPELRIFRVNR